MGEPQDWSTLSGDLRDTLLTHVRSTETPWSKMSEKAQRQKIDAIERAAEDTVKRAVNVISARGFDHVRATLGKFSVDGGKVKGTFETIVSEANVVALSDHQGQTVLLVLACAEDFMGESAPAEADPDQPDLPVEDPGEEPDDDGAEEHDADAGGPSSAPDAGIQPFLKREQPQATA